MKITEMIKELVDVRREHGDLPIFLADRYTHFEIKRTHYCDATEEEHFCIRMHDEIKYDD